MKKILLLHFVFLYLININAQTPNQHLESIVEKYTADSSFNGSLIIAKGDDIIYQTSFGFKNYEKKTKNTCSTSFPIASLTKQFTAAAILLLQQNNKLSINDEVGEYIEVPKSMHAIPIKYLLNNTSGIPDYWQNNVDNQKDSIYEFLFQKGQLQFNPNSKYEYSNSGFFLLGELIASVSGKTYAIFLEENIFKPLGMINTYVNTASPTDRAIGYNDQWEQNDYLMTTADGGIISTVEDLYLWDQSLLNHQILNATNTQLMATPNLLNHGAKVNYALGWNIKDDNNKILYHTGWLASFGSYNQVDLETGYFIILLSNKIRPELLDLIDDVNQELYKKE